MQQLYVVNGWSIIYTILQCNIEFEFNMLLARRTTAGEACKAEWRFDMTQKIKSAPALTQEF